MNNIRREIPYTVVVVGGIAKISRSQWVSIFRSVAMQEGVRINANEGELLIHPVQESVQINLYLDSGMDICQFIPMGEMQMTDDGTIQLGSITLGTMEASLEDAEEYIESIAGQEWMDMV